MPKRPDSPAAGQGPWFESSLSSPFTKKVVTQWKDALWHDLSTRGSRSRVNRAHRPPLLWQRLIIIVSQTMLSSLGRVSVLHDSTLLYNRSSPPDKEPVSLDCYSHPHRESNIKVSLNSLLHHTMQKLCRHCSHIVGTPARPRYSSPLTFWSLQGISAKGC